jgi:hypothetical protein
MYLVFAMCFGVLGFLLGCYYCCWELGVNWKQLAAEQKVLADKQAGIDAQKAIIASAGDILLAIRNGHAKQPRRKR